MTAGEVRNVKVVCIPRSSGGASRWRHFPRDMVPPKPQCILHRAASPRSGPFAAYALSNRPQRDMLKYCVLREDMASLAPLRPIVAVFTKLPADR